MADDYKAPSRVISTNIGEVGDDPPQLKYLECLVLVVRRMAQGAVTGDERSIPPLMSGNPESGCRQF